MLRYPLALLLFLTPALPVMAQNCGPLCDVEFWVSANDANIEAEIGVLTNAGGPLDEPLRMAIDLSNPASIRALISAGADVNDSSTDLPPLSRVINSRNAALAPLFLDTGAEVNAKGGQGLTALHFAAAALNQPQTVALLIAAGAEVNAQSISGETPLHLLAILASHSQEAFMTISNIGILKNAGADFNLQNDEGQTALHIAASGQNLTMVSLFLAAGADGNLLDTKGRTPLAIARATLEPFNSPQVLAALEAAQ